MHPAAYAASCTPVDLTSGIAEAYLRAAQLLGLSGAGSACPVRHQQCSLGAEHQHRPASTSRLQESIQLLSQPLVVHASAVSVPHPEKVRDGTTKAVNKRHHGFAGEDAYFCTSGP